MKPRRVALLVIVVGACLLAYGAGLIYRPAGVIVAGLAAVLCGLFLIDDGEDVRESGTARSSPVRRR